jgi:peptide/nickel transport system substrate-binding protein
MLNLSRFSISLNHTFAIFLILAVIAGCGDKDTRAIRFGLATAVVTLDPRYATDATSYRLTRLIYRPLVDFDEAHRPIPALARWEQMSPVHYRFFLEPSQYFHDGSELGSDDVIATYRSVLDPGAASPHRGSLTNIESIDTPSPLIVDFKLGAPDPLFPGLLVIGIMPAHLIADLDGALESPVGSGPFALDGPPSDTRLRLRRVSDQQAVEFITVRDATVRALKMLHGEIDLMQGSMTPELVDWLDRRDGIHARYRPGTTFTYLGFNLRDADVGDPRLRRAIAHAIDRASLTRFMFGGHARLAQAIFTPDHWAGHAGLTAIEYNPELAREILAELGYSQARPLQISYKTSSDHFRLRIATAIQDQLARVGVEVEISSYDWGTFYADVKAGRFQMYALSWVGLKQPDIFRYAFHSGSVPPDGANRGRYRAEAVDRMIEEAEAIGGLRERAVLYRGIQEQLLVDLPYIPLWYEDNTLIVRDSVAGYDTGLDGYYDGLATAQWVGPDG